ncbi:hypothetical protein Tco_0638158 [Tanacetum coccineum]
MRYHINQSQGKVKQFQDNEKRRYCSKVLLLFESTAHYAQSTARCESTAVMFEDDIVQCVFLDGFESQMLCLREIIMARIWRFIEEVIMNKIEYCLFDVVVEFHSTARCDQCTTEKIKSTAAIFESTASVIRYLRTYCLPYQISGKSTTTTTTIFSKQSQDKGKGIMIKEPVKSMMKKDLIRLDEEIASKLQAEFDKEERLAKEKAKKEKEVNIALIEEWDDIQAKVDADYRLAERQQAEEQE